MGIPTRTAGFSRLCHLSAGLQACASGANGDPAPSGVPSELSARAIGLSFVPSDAREEGLSPEHRRTSVAFHAPAAAMCRLAASWSPRGNRTVRPTREAARPWSVHPLSDVANLALFRGLWCIAPSVQTPRNCAGGGAAGCRCCRSLYLTREGIPALCGPRCRRRPTSLRPR